MRSGAATAALVRTAWKRWGARHHWRCVYCGRVGNQVDHFWPEHLGGTSEAHNLVPACEACNSRKRAQHPVTWMKAVGVPFERAKLLWEIYQDPDLPTPQWDQFPRIALTYPPRPRKGEAPCGTDSAYRRHRRRHEHCPECREAHRAANAEWKARRGIADSSV